MTIRGQHERQGHTVVADFLFFPPPMKLARSMLKWDNKSLSGRPAEV